MPRFFYALLVVVAVVALLQSTVASTKTDAHIDALVLDSAELILDSFASKGAEGRASSASSASNELESSVQVVETHSKIAERTTRLARVIDPVVITLSSTDSNDTLATKLCPEVSSATTDVTVAGYTGGNFFLPDCLAESGTGVVNFNGSGLLFYNFSSLPRGLTNLLITNSVFSVNTQSATSALGFNFVGDVASVNWDDIFSNFTFLKNITISSTNLFGSLPAVLPSRITYFDVSKSLISGALPRNFFSAVTGDYHLNAAGCQLTGLIPADFLGHSSFTPSNVYVNLAANHLNGSIPSDLLVSFASASLNEFTLVLSSNNLTGSLTPNFVPSSFLTPLGSLSLDFGRNKLSGSYISNFLGDISSFLNVNLVLKNNQLVGPLPISLFTGAWTVPGSSSTLVVDMSFNSIDGQYPESFIANRLSVNSTLASLKLIMNNNRFSGSLPVSLFYFNSAAKRDVVHFEGSESALSHSTSWSSSALTSRDDASSSASPITTLSFGQSLVLDLANNRFDSPFPAGVFSMRPLMNAVDISFDISNNSFSGPFPQGLFTYIPNGVATINLNLESNNFTGPLPDYCWSSNPVTAYYGHNQMTGNIPSGWSGCSFAFLSIAGQFALNGSLPSDLFTNAKLLGFSARNTPLSGTLPPIALTLRTLDLSFTNMDFCNTTSSFPSDWQGSCSGGGTTMCQCAAAYNQCDLPTCAIPPTMTPIPSTPTVSLPSPPTVRRCPQKTRPSPDFICVDGTWTAPAVNTTTLTVPDGAGTIVVNGNLTSKTVVLQGVGSTINITGSVTNLTTITVELTPQQIAALSGSKTLQILITTSNDSSTDLSSVGVNAQGTSGCKKVKVEKVVLDEGRTLGAYFSVDKSGCNTWWIILVSVVVGLIVLTLITLALLAVFCKPFREKVRPYSRARSVRMASNP